ncbi:hypothetical protein BDZ91DRAFT_734961 [Kalaharituber pfeilii]|nr:hypothetical protein BDZ91DRAFT_734961 [Kalaharituber pfeilii]
MTSRAQLFIALPLDITLIIIPFLAPNEIVALRLVNRSHHAIFTSEPVCKVSVRVWFGHEPTTSSLEDEGQISFRKLFDTIYLRRERFRRGRPTSLSEIQAGSPIQMLPYVSRFDPGRTVLVSVQNGTILAIYQLDLQNAGVVCEQRDKDISGSDVNAAHVRRIDIGSEVEQHPGLRTTPGKRMRIGRVLAGQDGKLLLLLLNVAAVGDNDDERANKDDAQPGRFWPHEECQEIMLAVVDIDVPSSSSTSSHPTHVNKSSASTICQLWPWTCTDLYPFHYAPRFSPWTFMLPAAINRHFAVYMYHVPSREHHYSFDYRSTFVEDRSFVIDRNSPGLHLAVVPVLGRGQLPVTPVLGKSALHLLADPEFEKCEAHEADIAVDRAGIFFFHAINRRKLIRRSTFQSTAKHVMPPFATICIDIYKVKYGASTSLVENGRADQIVSGVERVATVALDGDLLCDVPEWPVQTRPESADSLSLNPSFHAPTHLKLPESKHHMTLTMVFKRTPTPKKKVIVASYTFPMREGALQDFLSRCSDNRYGLLSGDEVFDPTKLQSPDHPLTSKQLTRGGYVTGDPVNVLTPDLLWYPSDAKRRAGAPLAAPPPATHLADYVLLPPIIAKWPPYAKRSLDAVEIPLFNCTQFRYFRDMRSEENGWSLSMKPSWSVRLRLERRVRLIIGDCEVQNRRGRRGGRANSFGTQLEVPISMTGSLDVLAAGDGWVLCGTSNSVVGQFVIRFD